MEFKCHHVLGLRRMNCCFHCGKFCNVSRAGNDGEFDPSASVNKSFHAVFNSSIDRFNLFRIETIKTLVPLVEKLFFNKEMYIYFLFPSPLSSFPAASCLKRKVKQFNSLEILKKILKLLYFCWNDSSSAAICNK